MNVFRLLGDLLHLVSFIVLGGKLWKSKRVDGVSLKTQELYLLVFCTRYLDLFIVHPFYDSLTFYNTCMKIIYISASAAIVYLFRFKEPWKTSYKKEEDSFLHLRFAVAPCVVLALLINNYFAPLEILWTFSIYLEAIAIMPQLILLQRYGNVENITANYVFVLGAYRALYILNWVYRYSTEEYYHSQWITWISGIVQTGLYCDFFYYYARSKYYGKTMALPK